jgi:phospholipid-translocating ATPase
MEDVYMKRKESDIMNMNENSNMSNTSGIYNRKINKREKDSIVRDCINALALCHNVTPVVDKEGVKTFQASSPDEIALVKTAEDLGVILKDRNEHQITLINSIGIEEKYNILANFPFSSESKRMGIVL